MQTREILEILQGSFVPSNNWNKLLKKFVSLTMFASGIFLTTTSRGATLPLLIGSALTGAGISGGMYAITKPEEELSDEFIKECVNGAIITASAAGAALFVKEIAKRMGEYIAEKTFKKIDASAAKQTLEKMATHLVNELAKMDVIISVAEIKQHAIKEIGKRFEQHTATQLVSGVVGGAVSRACSTIVKKRKFPIAQKIAEDVVAGSVAGGMSSIVHIMTLPTQDQTITTIRAACQKIGRDTIVGATSHAVISLLSKAVTNKIKGKPAEKKLKEAVLVGTAVGAASSLITSASACAMDFSNPQKEFNDVELIGKQTKNFFDNAEQLAQAKNYEDYLKLFTLPKNLQQYIEESFSKYLQENLENLTGDQVKQLNDIKARVVHDLSQNSEITERVSEKMLGHFQNQEGHSALSAGVHVPGIINTGQLIVGNGGSVFFNNVKLSTVDLEGNNIVTSSDFQALCMIEAYHQAPTSMRPHFSKEIAIALLRSELSNLTMNEAHQQVSYAVMGSFKSGAMDTVAVLTGFQGHAFQVTFILKNSLVYPIIDNYGGGMALFHTKVTHANGHVQYQPVQLAPFDISTLEGEQQLSRYLQNLSIAKYSPRSDSLNLIYNSQPRLVNAMPLPSVNAQTVGNCSLYNQQPEAERQLAKAGGAYTHFISTAVQFLKAIRNAARFFHQQNEPNAVALKFR